MPTYEYRCNECEEQVEIFQSIKDKPKRKCPSCGGMALERLISGGGAILFKGSGFYETDYRSASYKKAAEADKKATTGDGDSKKSGEKAAEKATDSSASKKSSDAKPAKKAAAKP